MGGATACGRPHIHAPQERFWAWQRRASATAPRALSLPCTIFPPFLGTGAHGSASIWRFVPCYCAIAVNTTSPQHRHAFICRFFVCNLRRFKANRFKTRAYVSSLSPVIGLGADVIRGVISYVLISAPILHTQLPSTCNNNFHVVLLACWHHVCHFVCPHLHPIVVKRTRRAKCQTACCRQCSGATALNE